MKILSLSLSLGKEKRDKMDSIFRLPSCKNIQVAKRRVQRSGKKRIKKWTEGRHVEGDGRRRKKDHERRKEERSWKKKKERSWKKKKERSWEKKRTSRAVKYILNFIRWKGHTEKDQKEERTITNPCFLPFLHSLRSLSLFVTKGTRLLCILYIYILYICVYVKESGKCVCSLSSRGSQVNKMQTVFCYYCPYL